MRHSARALLLAAVVGISLSGRALAAPFTTGSVALLRVGDGTAALTATGTPGSIVEVNPATGAVIQTIPLPSVANATSGDAPCVFLGNSNVEGLMTLSGDGKFLVVPCYNAAVGTSAIPSGPVTIARVDASGGVTTRTFPNMTTAGAQSFRSVVSLNASRYYLGTTYGLRTVVHGATVGTYTTPVTSATTLRGIALVPLAGTEGELYGAVTASPYGVARLYSQATLPTTSSSMSVVAAIMPGTQSSGSFISSFVFDESGALYTGCYSGSGTATGLLQKYVYNGTGWSMAAGFPQINAVFTLPSTSSFTPAGLKSLLLGRDPAAPTVPVLYAVNSLGTSLASYLIRYNTASATWAMVGTAGAPTNTQYLSVAWAPVEPTPSNTPTPSTGSSPTPSPSGTATSTGSPTTTPQLCSPFTTVGSAFAANSLLVMRVGSGTSPLTAATSREFYIDEYSLSGVRLQSIALPPSNYVQNTNTPTESSGSRTEDGLAVFIPAYAGAPSGATLTSAATKIVLRFDSSGAWSEVASYLSSAISLRGVVSLSSAPTAPLITSESIGIRTVPQGTVGGTAANGAVVSIVSAGNNRVIGVRSGVVYYSNTSGIISRVANPTVADSTVAVVRGASSSSSTSHFVFQADDVMWTSDFQGTVGISRFVYTAANDSWSSTPGYPRSVSVVEDNVTYTGARGLAGLINPSTGAFTLYFTSAVPGTATSAGGNALLSFNTETGVFARVARACAFTELRTIVLAPVPPTPTPAATSSPSPSGTATSSLPAGATPSGTGSASPTGSVTASASRTSSTTPTPTSSPSATVSPGVPFSVGSLALLRVGDGVAALGAGAAPVAVLEVDPATGAVRQTIALPSGPATPFRNPCTVGGTAVGEGLLSTSADGRMLVAACYGQSELSAAVSTITARTVATVSAWGVVDTRTAFTTVSGESLRSATSPDGSRFYLGTTAGVKTVAYAPPAATAAVALTASASIRSVQVVGGALYVSTNTAPYGVSRLFGEPLPSNGTASAVSVTANILPGTANSGANTHSFLFDDVGALYTTGSAVSGSSGVLHKYTLVGSLWASAAGYPKQATAISWTALDGVTMVTPTGMRAMVGARDTLADRFILYLVTGGGAALVRYDTVAESWAAVAEAPVNTAFFGLAWAPVAPSSSATFGATPSSTATPPRTASSTPTPAITTTPAATSTRTTTATPTASPARCSVDAPGVPFSSGGTTVALLRIGDGTSPMAGMRELFVDEVSLVTGGVLQSIPIPGCVANTGLVTENGASRTLDGGHMLIPCYPTGPSTSIANATTPKAVVTVSSAGVVAMVARYTSTSMSLRMATGATAGVLGSKLWVGESLGIKALVLGATADAVGVTTIVSSGTQRGSALWDGSLYSVQSTAGSVSMLSAAQLASATQPSTLAPVAGLSTASGLLGSIAFQDASTLWGGEYTGSAGVQKWERSANGTWVAAAGFPKAVSVTFAGESTIFSNGVRGVTGYTPPSGGAFTLLLLTSMASFTAGGNLLVAYDTVADSFTPVARACPYTEWRGMALAPIVPSASASPSGAPSATSSPSGAATSSATPSPSSSPTGSVTASPPVTGSVTQTASPSAAATPTSSPSSAETLTSSPSSAATQTASPSSAETQTGSPSGSGTAAATVSSTGTQSGTGSGSGSATAAATASGTAAATASGTAAATASGTAAASLTGTAASTGTASRSATGTRSKTAVATRSRTGSRTRTASATRTKTKTRTRTRTPSKKKKMLA